MNQKGFSPLIVILGIILVIGVAGGAYYLGRQTTQKPQTQNPEITSQTPQSPNPTKQPFTPINSQNNTIIVNKNNDGSQTVTVQLFNFQLTLPKNWTIKETDRRPEPTQTGSGISLNHDCADYVINSSDGFAILMLKPECETAVLKLPGQNYDELPADAVTVKRADYNPWVRYFDSQKGQYVYVREITTMQDVQGRIYDGGIYLSDSRSLLAIAASLSYTGPDSQKSQYLNIADNIISSLQLYYLK